jgi:transcription termination factor Rho
MAELENKTLKEIYAYAKDFKIPYYSQMNKKELSLAVIRAQAEKQGFFYMEGVLDIVGQDGYGFLRPINYASNHNNALILLADELFPPLCLRFANQNDESVRKKYKERPHFPALTALYPEKQLVLETTPGRLSTRMIDIFSPVGFGRSKSVTSSGRSSIKRTISSTSG